MPSPSVPGPVALGCELARLGVENVIVGSTATYLLDAGRGDRPRRPPRDLDLALDDDAVPPLVAALAELGVDGAALLRRRPPPRRVATGWCPLDVFADPPPAVQVFVDGLTLRVAG